MPAPFLLGIDIGSTRMKGALFDTEGREVAFTFVEYPILHKEPLSAEHSASVWLSAFKKITRKLIRDARASPDDIAGISVDCLCPSLIPVNKNGKPLMNSIFFMDRRNVKEADWIERKVGSEAIFSRTGNRIAQSAFSAPIMLWIKRRRPQIFKETFKFLHGNGFLEAYLTGEFSMDWTNASLTLLFETGGSKRWSTGLCEDIGIPVKKLPELKASWEVVGEVTRKASSETGLAKGIPVTAGGADTASAALGLGVVEHGDAMEDAGTATKLAICVDRPLFLRETLNRCHVVPDRWLLVAASSATGAALRWLKEQLGEYDKLAVATKRKNPYELMDRDAARSLPGARGLILLPYLAPGGERSPIWDPYARGVIFGLTLSHTKGDLIRAFLEASAYALMHNIETVEGYSVRIRSLRVSGGQARSRLWRSIKADITRKPVELTSRIEATVFGTALLAGVGSGHYSDLRSVAKRLVHVKERIHPHRAHKLIYHRSFAIYKLLYEKLKEEFRKLAIEGAHLKS